MITGGTLRFQGGAASTNLQGNNSLGDTILFNGFFFGLNPAYVQVTYGDAASNYDYYTCTSLLVTDTVIQCRTGAGTGPQNGLRFKVNTRLSTESTICFCLHQCLILLVCCMCLSMPGSHGYLQFRKHFGALGHRNGHL